MRTVLPQISKSTMLLQTKTVIRESPANELYGVASGAAKPRRLLHHKAEATVNSLMLSGRCILS